MTNVVDGGEETQIQRLIKELTTNHQREKAVNAIMFMLYALGFSSVPNYHKWSASMLLRDRASMKRALSILGLNDLSDPEEEEEEE